MFIGSILHLCSWLQLRKSGENEGSWTGLDTELQLSRLSLPPATACNSHGSKSPFSGSPFESLGQNGPVAMSWREIFPRAGSGLPAMQSRHKEDVVSGLHLVCLLPIELPIRVIDEDKDARPSAGHMRLAKSTCQYCSRKYLQVSPMTTKRGGV